jgi:DNA-directed RNA polymerase omega subunit
LTKIDEATFIAGPLTAKGRDVKDARRIDCWPGIVSRFQLVVIARLRSKQLFDGALPRIPVGPLKRKNTGIALEELRRGLVTFSTGIPAEVQKHEV